MNKAEYDAERFMDGFMDGINIGIKNIADQFKELKEKCERLNKENDKLRELGEVMLKCIVDEQKGRQDCWSCPAHKQFDELRWYCCIKDEAAELGIGVDA